MKRILCILAICLMAAAAGATNLRGRVDGRSVHSPYPFPAGRVSVALLVPDGAGHWRMAYSTMSGPDGMFYFVNIPPGNYVMQVAGRLNFNVSVGQMPQQDLAPVVVNF